MIATTYQKKDNFTCNSCINELFNKESFEYTTYITKARLKVCTKCFVQQFGKKNANEIKEENEN